MDSKEVLMPFIHEHPMMPLKDTGVFKYCDCCGRFDFKTDGYKCESCHFFIRKSCAESPVSMQHPSHPVHTLQLQRKDLAKTRGYCQYCDLCGKKIGELLYGCYLCEFQIDLYCAKYPPPEVLDISEMHHHKLIFLKKHIKFNCAACGETSSVGVPYKFHECDLAFHVDCVWHPSELQIYYPHHPIHPLKPHIRHPAYSDKTCSLCKQGIGGGLFYHCSFCNFSLDQFCFFDPPLKSLLNLKVHDHQLTLLPRRDYFTCNACGLEGDRSPYICVQCGFMIHQGCLNLPRVININRHDHRVFRSSVLGFVNSVCGVCRNKVDWTRGGFYSQKSLGYVVHSKCATRRDVWNGKELEGVPEETEDIEPYVVIDDNTIRHFSHEEHTLRLHINGDLYDDNKRCMACTHPICLQSYYSCIECDFILHKNCAGLVRKKRHFLHNERLTLVTEAAGFFDCDACHRMCNGFRYVEGAKTFDVGCVSISEPFYHQSHPDHPLYHKVSPNLEKKRCNGCNNESIGFLRCIEINCEFVLCFKCATLPLMVKHRVDDYPLSLCYGEKPDGTYWCDICEKETDPKNWFYTCKDHQAILHTKCVLGDFSNLMPKGTIEDWYEVMLNNSISRPICSKCKLHCIYPIIWKKLGTSDYYVCSIECWLK